MKSLKQIRTQSKHRLGSVIFSVVLRWLRSHPQASQPTAPKSLWAKLNAEKIAARQTLLAQSPQQAQQSVNQVLYPELWVLTDNEAWCDRIPRTDAQDGPQD